MEGKMITTPNSWKTMAAVGGCAVMPITKPILSKEAIGVARVLEIVAAGWEEDDAAEWCGGKATTKSSRVDGERCGWPDLGCRPSTASVVSAATKEKDVGTCQWLGAMGGGYRGGWGGYDGRWCCLISSICGGQLNVLSKRSFQGRVGFVVAFLLMWREDPNVGSDIHFHKGINTFSTGVWTQTRNGEKRP